MGDGAAVSFGMFIILLIMVSLFVGGCSMGEDMIQKEVDRLRKEAIEHGYAHQVMIDEVTGETEWQWIEPVE